MIQRYNPLYFSYFQFNRKNEKSYFTLRRSSLSEVYVQVLDENDNNPYFVTDINNLNVMENSKIGTEIASIQARDPDSGDYGKITYLLDRMSSEVSPKLLFILLHFVSRSIIKGLANRVRLPFILKLVP